MLCFAFQIKTWLAHSRFGAFLCTQLLSLSLERRRFVRAQNPFSDRWSKASPARFPRLFNQRSSTGEKRRRWRFSWRLSRARTSKLKWTLRTRFAPNTLILQLNFDRDLSPFCFSSLWLREQKPWICGLTRVLLSLLVNFFIGFEWWQFTIPRSIFYVL